MDWYYTITFVLRALIGTTSGTAGFILVLVGWDPTVATMLGLGLIAFAGIVAVELIRESLS